MTREYKNIDKGLMKDMLEHINDVNDPTIIPRMAHRFNISPTDDIFLEHGIKILDEKTFVKIDENGVKNEIDIK